MVRKTVVFFFFLIFVFPHLCSAQKVWQAQNSGIEDVNIHTISVFAGDDSLICATSASSLYFSENSGHFWRKVFSIEAEGGRINFVGFDTCEPRIIYLATSKGLFVTRNQGEHWQRVFRRVKEEAKDVGWIALDPRNNQKIYIGTKEGLYVSSDSGAGWQKSRGGLPHSEVHSIAVHPLNSQVLYLANNYGLFKSIDAAQTWERVYVTSYRVTEEDEEEQEEDEEEDDEEEESQQEGNQGLINCIAVDKGNPKRIFIATGQGVFVSPDAGEVWNKLPTQGLISDYVNFIVLSDKQDVLYAATKKGVFKFLPALNSWQQIYQGMTAVDVRNLALSMDGRQLFAGTNRGIFKTVSIKNVEKQTVEEKVEKDEKVEKNEIDNEIDFEQVLKELSLNEPTIEQVQEAALRHAKVIHPDNVRALRRNARLKALLPTVSVDYDKTIYAGSTGKKDAFVGPRDWGLSLSWNVGDLIFNSQLRLLNGSDGRLMVQLRDDILNEVTRLYYERRRLQSELILTPPETAGEGLSKALKLEELTANIDALTGGRFSRNLKK